MDCSCPDWAGLCKHLAASLYGVGARLDQNPGLLFLLRGVDPADLISQASAKEAVRQTGVTPAMSDAEVSDVFGIELDASAPAAPPVAAPAPAAAATPAPLAAPVPAPKPKRAKKSKRSPAVKPKTVGQISAAGKAKVAAAVRARWARAKALAKGKASAGAVKRQGKGKATP
jgi:uncharacterized Zn finger protein